MDRARNRELSPLYHVERIRIPLQVHQGVNDSRVPRAQSDWLVQRLVDFLTRQLRSTQGKGVKGPNASRCHHCPVF